jgi:uncharacterized protein (TIGR03083 family)
VTLEYQTYIDVLQAESVVFSRAARAAGVDARVPSCPDWNVADLLQHVGRLHRWVTDIVVNEPDDPMREWTKPFPPAAELILWFDEGVTPFVVALTEAGPDKVVWSWSNDQSTRFWARRQAHELAVHRYDMQLAAGTPQTIERALAVDGIDEYFDLIPSWRGAGNVRGAGETLHFHCTDGAGEWLARLDPDGLVVTREHAKGDVAARGTASDLLLYLYGRVMSSELEVFGDAALLTRWRELVSW